MWHLHWIDLLLVPEQGHSDDVDRCGTTAQLASMASADQGNKFTCIQLAERYLKTFAASMQPDTEKCAAVKRPKWSLPILSRSLLGRMTFQMASRLTEACASSLNDPGNCTVKSNVFVCLNVIDSLQSLDIICPVQAAHANS